MRYVKKVLCLSRIYAWDQVIEFAFPFGKNVWMSDNNYTIKCRYYLSIVFDLCITQSSQRKPIIHYRANQRKWPLIHFKRKKRVFHENSKKMPFDRVLNFDSKQNILFFVLPIFLLDFSAPPPCFCNRPLTRQYHVASFIVDKDHFIFPIMSSQWKWAAICESDLKNEKI